MRLTLPALFFVGADTLFVDQIALPGDGFTITMSVSNHPNSRRKHAWTTWRRSALEP